MASHMHPKRTEIDDNHLEESSRTYEHLNFREAFMFEPHNETKTGYTITSSTFPDQLRASGPLKVYQGPFVWEMNKSSTRREFQATIFILFEHFEQKCVYHRSLVRVCSWGGVNKGEVFKVRFGPTMVQLSS